MAKKAKTEEKGTAKPAASKTVAKKKSKKVVTRALVTVNSSYNNTLVCISDLEGNVLVNSSPGVIGFKGSKKGTAYAATKAAEDAVMKVKKYGVIEASVEVKGSGMGRQAAVKGLRAGGLKIRSLMDVTPIAHGGTNPRKKPRGS